MRQPSERHRMMNTYVGLVDGSSAEREARYELANSPLVLAEDEAGKARAGPDRRDRVVEVGEAEDRQNRPKTRPV